MITYQKLSHQRAAFKHLSGLSVAEFDALFARFEPAWIAAEAVRRQRPQRQRAIGGGRRYGLSSPTQLLMVLVWLRLYLTTDALGSLFSVHKSTVSRTNRRVLRVLRTVSQGDIAWPTRPPRGERTWEEALHDHPDLLHLLDVTEQPVQRPQDKTQEKLYYSGKQRTHTCKHALGVNEQGLIRALTAATPGSVHDLTHVRQAGVLAQIPLEVTVGADAGFVGLAKDLPAHSVVLPHKAQRNHPLTPDQRRINAEFSAIRVIVENVFAHLKHFASLAQRFRHNVTVWHSDIFCVVAAIVNRRTQARLAHRNPAPKRKTLTNRLHGDLARLTHAPLTPAPAVSA